MTTYNKSPPENSFRSLKAKFRVELPFTIKEIQNLWKELINNNHIIINDLLSQLLHLADAAGTYGTDEVSFLARKCYLELKLITQNESGQELEENVISEIDQWLMQLKVIVDKWLSIDNGNDKEVIKNKNSKVIFTFVDDGSLRKDLEDEASNN